MLPASPAPAPRRFEITARRIMALIQGECRVGDRLPAERELARMFAVSRPTIREALLSLQMAGVLDIRTSSGAYVLSREDGSEVRQFEGFGPFENLQAREMIEPQIAALAAQHASELHRARMAESLAAMRLDHAAGREADAADHRFHLLLAEASGNGVLVGVCDGLWRGQIESRIWQDIHSYMPMAEYRPVWLADHERIFRAVDGGDGRAASVAMAAHLKNIRDALMASTVARRVAPAATDSGRAG